MCKTSEATTPVVQPSYASAKDIDPLTPSSSGTDQSGSQITRTLKKCIPAMVHNSITFGVPLALFHLTRNVGAAALSLPALYLLCSTRILRPFWLQHAPPATVHKRKGTKRVAVLGAGPVGLVAVKELLAEGHEVVCFEASGSVGGVYTNVYESARLTSSPFVTAFSDYPPPLTDHVHYTAGEYVKYLKGYAAKFGVDKHVHLHTRVESVKKEVDGTFTVKVSKKDEVAMQTFAGFDHVAVCTGPNGHPNMPTFPGQETFKGDVVHSSQYVNAEVFRGKRVLVVGLGETSADVSAEVAAVASEAVLSVRVNGAFVIPRVNPLTNMNNDYDSNRLRYSLPKSLHNGTAYLCALLNYICGTMSECSAKRFELLRKSRKGAFSQFATKSDHFIPYLVSGDLTLRPGIKEFNGSSVTFEDGTVFENIDCMLLCTGYGGPAGRMFSYFDQDLLGCGCVSKMYKYMFIPHHGSDMVFMGFARPHIGSIPPIAELQARYFAQLVSGTKELPTIKAMEKDIQAACASWERDFGGRLKTMVNWIPYSDALADAIGCRPPASLWITDPALALKLVTGPFTNFHFRLAGPDACPEETRKVIMSLPCGMRKRDMLWFGSLHLVTAFLRMGGLISDTRTACSVY